jgi:LPS O-antigen subunit length determinant protein (WzzB/FepE family)
MPRKVTLKTTGSDFIGTENDADGTKSGGSDYRFDINIFELAQMLFKKRRLIAGITFGFMVITTVYLFLQPNLYTSSATILPTGRSNSLSAIKSLIGLGDNVSNSDDNSSALYPLILSSNLIVDAVLSETYSFEHKSRTMSLTLMDYLGVENKDRLRDALRDITLIRSDNRLGEIRVGVETRYPAFSRAILENYLVQLENFNHHKRRSLARDNEQYLARQLDIIGQELRETEDNLEAFQKANIDWAISGSPEILKELGRLRRTVESKAATHTLLTQEYEMAKLETQKDLPIVRILDSPSLPTIKSGPFRRNLIIMSGVLSFMLIAFGLIVRHLMIQATSGPNRDEYDALRREFQTAFPRTEATINRIKSTVLRKTHLIKN